MDDVLKDDVDPLPGPIDQLDARDVDLSNLTTEEKALLQTLSAVHPAQQIRLYQVDPLHAIYMDASETSVDSEALTTIQEAGYAIVGAGTERPRRAEPSDSENTPRKCAAVEFKPPRKVSDG